MRVYQFHHFGAFRFGLNYHTAATLGKNNPAGQGPEQTNLRLEAEGPFSACPQPLWGIGPGVSNLPPSQGDGEKLPAELAADGQQHEGDDCWPDQKLQNQKQLAYSRQPRWGLDNLIVKIALQGHDLEGE